MHAVGADGVGRDHRHQRRVDAAREPEHDVGEAVLLDVVARAEHQRLVDLALERQRLRESRELLAFVICATRTDLDHRQRGGHRSAARIEQPLAEDGQHVEVDDHRVLDELRRARDEHAVAVEHERRAVEDELVLPADLVHVDERARRVGGPRGQHALALAEPVGVVRRRVDVEHELGATRGLLGDRAVRNPRVFADGDAHLHARDLEEHERVGAGGEVALLVEHRVVGEMALVIRALHAAAGTHGRRVVEIAAGIDEADDGRTVPRTRRHLLHCDPVGPHEAGLEQKVLRRIPGDGQFWEHGHVAAGALRLAVRGDDAIGIAVEVADDRVQLAKGDADASHTARLPIDV